MKKITFDQSDEDKRMSEAFSQHDAQREEDWEQPDHYEYVPGEYTKQQQRRKAIILNRLYRAGKVWVEKGWAK